MQLGIGGYKPIAAEKVFSVNYGDCKALSNYMKAMLEVAGIKSNLVVIGNGMPSLNRNFASVNQANHMILCVPLEKRHYLAGMYKPICTIGLYWQ